ncbi:MAG: 23S rRNA (pseudouridine(1915)-N(3))-methyltransferase RlmH [Clostridia bacterium]|nr:23S rRNA (pseudouridine(1915)-N(3))-methyltransferase RlmH [Clostridia bacterium]MBR4442035.1 23S rRNA (pseudouridine(1915)-N(3))-methyltransferase RlmH [Clostridia bacterium]
MNVLVIGVGRLKEAWEREACAEYMKRLKRFCALEVRELDDQPEPDRPSEALNQKVMEREGRDILACIRPNDRVVALCIDGRSYDSVEFAGKMAAWSMDGRRLVLVIGGSLGLTKAVTDRADEKLSFSRFTFPHQLMRVILLEQVYRAFKIGANERYHK